MSETGISIVQLSILRALERHGPMTLSRLADDLAMERTSLYRTIDPLVESTAVQVKSAPTGKSKVAKLTAKGQHTIERVMPFWAKAQAQVLEEVTLTELPDFQRALNAIAKLSA
ncbi:MarR family winged helix-turn-helix transcriptional regulator [Aliiroseovarius sp. KMU-71]